MSSIKMNPSATKLIESERKGYLTGHMGLIFRRVKTRGEWIHFFACRSYFTPRKRIHGVRKEIELKQTICSALTALDSSNNPSTIVNFVE